MLCGAANKFMGEKFFLYTLLNNAWVEEEVIKKARKYFELFDNKENSYQNSYSVGKLYIQGKFIILDTYVRKDKKLKTDKNKYPPQEVIKRMSRQIQ